MLDSLKPHKTYSSVRIFKQGSSKRDRFDRQQRSYYASRLAVNRDYDLDLTAPLSRICYTEANKSQFRIGRPHNNASYFKRAEKSPKGRCKTQPKQPEANPEQCKPKTLRNVRLEELDTKAYLESQFSPTICSRPSPLTRFKKTKFFSPLDFWHKRECLSPCD